MRMVDQLFTKALEGQLARAQALSPACANANLLFAPRSTQLSQAVLHASCYIMTVTDNFPKAAAPHYPDHGPTQISTGTHVKHVALSSDWAANFMIPLCPSLMSGCLACDHGRPSHQMPSTRYCEDISTVFIAGNNMLGPSVAQLHIPSCNAFLPRRVHFFSATNSHG